MGKYVYYVLIGVAIWSLFPLLLLSLVAGLGKISKSVDLRLRFLAKIFLGLGSRRDMGIVRQFRGFDCGGAALENALLCLRIPGIQLSIPEPSSMLMLADGATEHNCKASGYDSCTLDFVQSILASEGKVLTLLKVTYPFSGWWVWPTAWILNLLIGHANASANHWVMVSAFSNKHVFITDPYFGNIRLSKKIFYRNWTRNILAVYPSGGRVSECAY
jgi:hypothetical protein